MDQPSREAMAGKLRIYADNVHPQKTTKDTKTDFETRGNSLRVYSRFLFAACRAIGLAKAGPFAVAIRVSPVTPGTGRSAIPVVVQRHNH
jgi:hypothetical protein